MGNRSPWKNKEEGRLAQNKEDDSLSNLSNKEGSHCLGEVESLLSPEVCK